MNRIDYYSKVMLTIIAMGVAWSCVSRERIHSEATAQHQPTTAPAKESDQDGKLTALMLGLRQLYEEKEQFKKEAHDLVVARQFRLVDEDGVTRILMGVGEDDVRIIFFDQEQSPCYMLGLANGSRNCEMAVVDSKGKELWKTPTSDR